MLDAGANYDNYRFASHQYWTCFMHPSQVYVGRCYIALRRDGNLDPFTDTTPEEREELVEIITSLHRTLNKLYQPDLFNYANLRNNWPHCHWHIIPRYRTPRVIHDHEFVNSRWGKNYAPYDKSFTIPESTFFSIRDDLRNLLTTKD